MKSKRKDEVVEMLYSCCNKCTPILYFKNLREMGHQLKSREEYLELANFGTGISSVERIILLNSLKDKDRCVCELEVIIDKSQSTVSHHLRKLETAGLITGYKKGNYTYYHLEKERLNDYISNLNAIFISN